MANNLAAEKPAKKASQTMEVIRRFRKNKLAMLGFAGLSAVPATLFVDRDGNLVGQGFYGALDEAGWRETIAERLEMTGR